MKQNFFAVDLGASSGRTILGVFSDDSLELKEINRFPNHLIQTGGHFYWDIYELYRNILEGLKTVSASGEEITSIGIDTWGVDFVCVGADGSLLRLPYSYRDPHTTGAPEKLFERVPRSVVYEKTGIQIMNFNTLFQFDTLHRCHDSAFEAADKVLFIPDALSYLLTGEMVTEYTIASTAQILNAYTKEYVPELLSAVGLSPEHFGRFVYPGAKVGTLTAEVQKITGLGPVPVIAVAGHDTGSAVAAVPAVDPDFAYLSSGTWSLMGIETKAPIINDDSSALNFTNEGGVEGTIRFLKNICGMWLLERCRPNWDGAGYGQLIEEAQASEPFRSLINPDDDVFANPSDMEQAIRDYCSATSQPVPETRGQIVRCIFESLPLRYRQVLGDLRKLSSREIRTLHVIGGGSRNDLLNQFTANSLGIPVVAGPSEATAIGNVMIQAMASGAATDVAGMRRLISRSIPLNTYLPQDSEVWDAAFAKFEKVCGK